MRDHAQALLKHFGEAVQTGEGDKRQAAKAIIDAPGTTLDFSGVSVESKEYRATFATDDLDIDDGDPLEVMAGRNVGKYVVRKVTALDDGVFSQAVLRRA